MNQPGRPSGRALAKRRAGCRHVVAGLLASLTGTGALAQGWTVEGEASLVSDYVERGVSYWPREAAAQGLVVLSDGMHWSASLTLTAPVEHAHDYQAVARASAYLSGDENWQLQARTSLYVYPGGGFYRFYNRYEFGLGARFRDLLSLDLTAIQLKEKEADDHLYPAIDLGLRWPLSEQWSLAGGIGRTEMMWWRDTWYTYADVGLAWQAGPWRATLRHIRTDEAARLYLDRSAEPRTTVSLSWAF